MYGEKMCVCVCVWYHNKEFLSQSSNFNVREGEFGLCEGEKSITSGETYHFRHRHSAPLLHRHALGDDDASARPSSPVAAVVAAEPVAVPVVLPAAGRAVPRARACGS